MLEDSPVVIVGGSSGIGLAVARALLERQARVTIASRSAEKLGRASESLNGRVSTARLDMRVEEDVKNFFSGLQGLDHLVITAAGAAFGNFLELEVEEARAFFDSKFWGPYTVARYAAPRIRPGGSVTFFAGAASRKASPGFSCGSALNSAMETLSRTLAVELAPIRVNTVSPGLTRTPVWELLGEEERAQLFEQASRDLPLGRVGKPEEVAHAVVFLLENSYMTGSILFPDGGYLLS